MRLEVDDYIKRSENMFKLRYAKSDFAFLNPKMQVEACMLNPAMLTSKTYHLICTPARCIKLVTDIVARREDIKQGHQNMQGAISAPLFVWEPMEGSCRPTELPSFYEALKFVDVFSPNEHELDLLFNGLHNNEDETMSSEVLRRHCDHLLTLGFGNKQCAVVVRMGASGCVIVSQNRFVSLPAFHQPPMNGSSEELAVWHDSKTKTWDVTGGGNAFLGGYCIGLLSWPTDQTDNHGFTGFEFAAIYGSVAASFAIEQVGMPEVSYRHIDGKELWNGHGKETLKNDFSIKPPFWIFLSLLYIEN